MADIRMCPRCCGRPKVLHTKRGYIWRHKCASFDGEFSCESKHFEKFGDAVKDWNKRVKNIDYIRKVALSSEYGNMLVHPHGEVLK